MKRFLKITGAALLGLGGCLAVYGNQTIGGYPVQYTIRQFAALAAGLLLCFILTNVSFRKLEKYAWTIGTLCLIMLFLVLFIGSSINGMQGWFGPVYGYSIQPSELAKGPYVLLLTILACRKEVQESIRFFHVCGICFLFTGLVMLEPDMGSAILFFIMGAIVLFAAGFRIRYPLALIGGAVVSGLIFLFTFPYAMKRIKGFLDPELYMKTSGWHILQFRYTMANGGWTGAEDPNAMWSARYLPLAHSDSAFAAVMEYSGVAGGLVIIAAFLLTAWIVRKTALTAPTENRQVFIFSAGFFPVIQGLLHIAVNTTLIPPTGVTLPLISCGGSSLLSVMIILGMIFSASEEEHIPQLSQAKSKE